MTGFEIPDDVKATWPQPVYCWRDHPNWPDANYCSRCGISIVPYPEFCHHLAECVNAACCPRDPSCID